MNSETDKKETIIMKATRLLQAKVGTGAVNKEKVEESQKIIENNGVDFIPMATEFLDQLQKAISNARKNNDADAADIMQEFIEIVMQIKGNAGMFDYPLVSLLAGIMLTFLESLDGLDKDVIDIVEAHHATLKLIIDNDMKTKEGAYGQELQTELENACQRYFNKHGADGNNSASSADVFFIE